MYYLRMHLRKSHHQPIRTCVTVLNVFVPFFSVLEALYIRKLDPELCVQKENVLSLQLFGTVRREGAK